MRPLIFCFFVICMLPVFSQSREVAQVVKIDPIKVKDNRYNKGAFDYQWSCDSTFYMSLFQNNDIKNVLNLMKVQEAAWNNGNIKGFMEYYWKNDSLKFIGSKGITFGWQKTMDNYLKRYPTKEVMGTLKFTVEESTQLSPASIYIIGKWELQKEKPVSGYFTLLWKKINNKWVIVSDHTS